MFFHPPKSINRPLVLKIWTITEVSFYQERSKLAFFSRMNNYCILPCIMHTFFAQIFEGKIKMHAIHGYNELYTMGIIMGIIICV